MGHSSFDFHQEMKYFSCQPRSGKFWSPHSITSNRHHELHILEGKAAVHSLPSSTDRKTRTHYLPYEAVHGLQDSLAASWIASVTYQLWLSSKRFTNPCYGIIDIDTFGHSLQVKNNIHSQGTVTREEYHVTKNEHIRIGSIKNENIPQKWRVENIWRLNPRRKSGKVLIRTLFYI
jgi:hypothetical protein